MHNNAKLMKCAFLRLNTDSSTLIHSVKPSYSQLLRISDQKHCIIYD